MVEMQIVDSLNVKISVVILCVLIETIWLIGQCGGCVACVVVVLLIAGLVLAIVVSAMLGPGDV